MLQRNFSRNCETTEWLMKHEGLLQATIDTICRNYKTVRIDFFCTNPSADFGNKIHTYGSLPVCNALIVGKRCGY